MADGALAGAGKLRREGLRLSAEDFQAVLRRHSGTSASFTGSAAGQPRAAHPPMGGYCRERMSVVQS